MQRERNLKNNEKKKNKKKVQRFVHKSICEKAISFTNSDLLWLDLPNPPSTEITQFFFFQRLKRTHSLYPFHADTEY